MVETVPDGEDWLYETKFDGLKRKRPYFINPPYERPREKITWLKPELIAEIKFAESTHDNLLRQANFKGLRADKTPKDVKIEKPQADILEVEGIIITHPEKVLFDSPIITKSDVVNYYEKISPRMLPYVKDRVLSVVRCPKGIMSSCFFMKHPNTESEQINLINVASSSNENVEYFYINSIPGIIHEVQMGTLEFHTWGSTVNSIETPDIMIFDLDPDEGMDLERIRQGVRDMKGILDNLSLKSYLKTSGGKGYHIVVPIMPNATWDTIHDFAKNIANVMEEKWPNRYTSNVRKEKRKGKIFIDWIRNGRGATSVAPYSIRARKGATVSMPISWEELDTTAPYDIDMPKAISRLSYDDPWEGFFENPQMLK